MKNSESEEIIDFIEILAQEMATVDDFKRLMILEEYYKDEKFKFLKEDKWKMFLKARLDISIQKNSSNNQSMTKRKPESNSEMKMELKNPVFTAENVPVGIMATMIKNQFKKVHKN
jgi:hypothetical protein